MRGFYTLIILAFTILTAQTQETSLDWAVKIGGAGFDQIRDLHIDKNDNTYLAGNFSGTADFDGSSNTLNFTSKGDQDAYVLKQNSDGTLAWAVAFGGSEDDYGYSVTTDSEHNVYVTGAFKGMVDFNPYADVDIKTAVGNFDIFISKFDPNGEYLWTKTIGNTSVDESKSITIDDNNDIYITGRFLRKTDFDPGSGVVELDGANSTPDAFILKLDSDGNFQWAHKIGTSSGLEGGIVVEYSSDGAVIVSGGFDSNLDFDPGPNEVKIFGNGTSEIFFVKYDIDGNFIWAKTFEGDGYETCQDMAIDRDGNIYATGWFMEEVDFDTGPGVQKIISEGAEDSFITKMNSQGNLVWVKQIGGPNLEWAYDIAVDKIGDVYSTGFFYGEVDFDPSAAINNITSKGIEDTYIHKLDANGNFVWVKQVGGTGSDSGYGIEIGDNGDIYVAGNFWNTADLDPETTILNFSNSGGADIFLLKMNQVIESSLNEYHQISSNYTASPNPSNGLVTINGFKKQISSKITVFNLEGKKIEYFHLPAGEESLVLDLNHLKAGIYIINIIDDQGSHNAKWIKM